MVAGVKIRGIYSTALTRLLLDSGYTLAEPSPEIQERFGLAPTAEAYDILIKDRDDLQGVDLTGEPEKICELLRLLQERLLDAVLLRVEPVEESEGLVLARIEFPGASKEMLDKLRSSVLPTLARHHRYRIILSRGLEVAEKSLLMHPHPKETIEREIFSEAILVPLRKAGLAKLEHVRASGRPIHPREGLLLEADEHRIVIKRFFSKGRYDGLDLPIEEGDYGITEAQEGAWYVKNTYFSKKGELKGDYYNINTPVELYPYGARYLDLEVDVVRRAGERPFLVDQERLAILAEEGLIGARLEKKAMEVADELLTRLQI